MVRFNRLVPPGAAVDAAALLDGLSPGDRAPDGRPHIALNMVTSLDGRAALDGRSAGLGSVGDRELFHRLRAQADAVMAGASTMRTERYGPIIRDPDLTALREARGQPAQPLAVTASRSLAFDPGLPLLADDGSHLVVLTPSRDAVLPPCRARVSYLRGEPLRMLLGDLRDGFGVRSIVCEGGPGLGAELLAGGLVDELFLSISPVLLAGRAPLTILDGAPARTQLELVWLLEHESTLHARYRVIGPPSPADPI